MDGWMVYSDGKKKGPFDTRFLQQMAASGMLKPSDQILKDGTNGWKKASELRELGPSFLVPVVAGNGPPWGMIGFCFLMIGLLGLGILVGGNQWDSAGAKIGRVIGGIVVVVASITGCAYSFHKYAADVEKRDERNKQDSMRLVLQIKLLEHGNIPAEDGLAFLQWVLKRRFLRSEEKVSVINYSMRLLQSKYSDDGVKLGVLEFWQAFNWAGINKSMIYQFALSLLQQNQSMKPFVLTLLRWFYGSQRPNKALTIYDEQAIANDIEACMKP